MPSRCTENFIGVNEKQSVFVITNGFLPIFVSSKRLSFSKACLLLWNYHIFTPASLLTFDAVTVTS